MSESDNLLWMTHTYSAKYLEFELTLWMQHMSMYTHFHNIVYHRGDNWFNIDNNYFLCSNHIWKLAWNPSESGKRTKQMSIAPFLLKAHWLFILLHNYCIYIFLRLLSHLTEMFIHNLIWIFPCQSTSIPLQFNNLRITFSCQAIWISPFCDASFCWAICYTFFVKPHKILFLWSLFCSAMSH